MGLLEMGLLGFFFKNNKSTDLNKNTAALTANTASNTALTDELKKAFPGTTDNSKQLSVQTQSGLDPATPNYAQATGAASATSTKAA